MKSIIRILVLMGFAIVLISEANAVGKLVKDPNLSANKTEIESTASDELLLREVSCESGYTRLHDAVAGISEKISFPLYCGKNKEDWLVRDIPLIVYTKDMPLGKLLRGIADATHTQFAAEKVRSDGKDKLTYRIFRDAKTAADIIEKVNAKRAGKITEAEWGWDALVAFAKSGIDDPSAPRDAVLFGKVLASLEPEAKKKVFSGEYLILTADNVAQTEQLRELYSLGWKKQSGSKKQKEPRPEDLQRSELRINLQDGGDSGSTGLFTSCYYVTENTDQPGWEGNYWLEMLNEQAEKLKSVKGFELPPHPAVPELPKPEDEYPTDRLVMLKTPQDWESPVLKTKINLEAPQGKEHFTFSDAVVAIAKASGFNITCEDFETHQNSNYDYGNGDPKFDTRVDNFFVKETTLGEALKKLDCYKVNWFINEQDKLIIGWAGDWRLHHRNLVRESLLTSLRTKLNGDGVQLDDVTPLVNLTYEQTGEWIRRSSDLYKLAWFNSYTDDICAWRIYESLNAEDKKLARSKAGLPLGKFDPDWLYAFFQQRHKKLGNAFNDESVNERIRREEEIKDALLSNPKTISTVVLHIKEVETILTANGNRINLDLVKLAQNLPKRYSIQLEGEVSGEKAAIDIQGPPNSFPILSKQRELEIFKELQSKTQSK